MEYCPKSYPDQYNQGISQNKAVHVYFSQAIPLVAYIDDSCLYLQEGKCDICRGVCQADAIDFNQTPKKTDINVGAIILSAGITPFDPSTKDEYGYTKMQNVVTSMDYERLLASTGPYEGQVLRASDKKHPKKNRLDSMRGFPTGNRRRKQLLLRYMLYLYSETGYFDKTPLRRC